MSLLHFSQRKSSAPSRNHHALHQLGFRYAHSLPNGAALSTYFRGRKTGLVGLTISRPTKPTPAIHKTIRQHLPYCADEPRLEVLNALRKSNLKTTFEAIAATVAFGTASYQRCCTHIRSGQQPSRLGLNSRSNEDSRAHAAAEPGWPARPRHGGPESCCSRCQA